jgi:CDP-paratose 2-epimerase
MRTGKTKPVLITGGAGFIGANLASRLLSQGEEVLIFDNLSRSGVETNLAWLQQEHPEGLSFVKGDIQNFHEVHRAVSSAGFVVHLAAQVAVTSSVDEPVHDFTVNTTGTLNVLEAIRASPEPPPLIYTSTNKVYGDLGGLDLCTNGSRYEPVDPVVQKMGIDERQPLSFHSPYGCSKGAADQYVLDYTRTYGLPGIVFRMSCIYGPRQFGNEDQGWLAHFLIRALSNEPVVLYGDGMQVRDVLYIDDLVDAFLLARRNIGSLKGQVFNMGGGPKCVTSLRELLALIGEMRGREVEIRWDRWRVGDQRYFVTDTSRFTQFTGWSPKISLEEGVRRLYAWLSEAQRTLPSYSVSRGTP